MDENQAKALRASFRDEQIQTKNIGQRSYNFINHAVITDRLISVDPDCCLLYTSPSPRDRQKSRMPSSA